MTQDFEVAALLSGADDHHLWHAGESAKGEFHCAECGYGVAVYRTLPPCPMCGEGRWEQTAWSPFGRSRVADS